LMSTDGAPLMCPVLAPEEHSVGADLVREISRPRAGWAVAGDDSHGGRDAIVGFAPVRLGDALSPGSLGGKRWLTFVRQNPEETYAPLKQLIMRVAGYGMIVFAVLW